MIERRDRRGGVFGAFSPGFGLAVALTASLWAAPAHAQTAANVLLVVNERSMDGEPIARAYIDKRGLPASNVCRISTATEEVVSRTDYVSTIEQPIWRCIASKQAQDRILYIVLTKGVPLRIDGTTGRDGSLSSVDSELTLLYRREAGFPSAPEGFVPNPYFAGQALPTTVPHFDHGKFDIYLVTRLDGFTRKDAIALIDRSVRARTDGAFVLRDRAAGGVTGSWMEDAVVRLRAQGVEQPVLLERPGGTAGQIDTLGYFSWGTNDPSFEREDLDRRFVPGALAGMLVSTDARTFKEPPATWSPSNDWANREARYAGSPQPLIGALIRAGATGAVGYVSEPYLDGTLRPDVLFPAYANGLNLAEAFYAAMPYLSWQAIVVGDPLCAPFPRTPLSPAELDAPIVAETEMPRHFSARYLDSFVQNGDPWLTVSAADRRERVTEISKPEARIPYAKAQSRRWRGDDAGNREALAEAIAIDPRFTAARLLIATQEEQRQNYDIAVEQYRAILEYDPNEPVSLNNLAYHLTVREDRPDEALTYAERACALRPNVPLFLDTLAWTQFLLGQVNEAARTITNALRSNPMDADLHWHAAAIFDAVHQVPQARVALKTALSLKPSLGDTAEVAALRERLQMTED